MGATKSAMFLSIPLENYTVIGSHHVDWLCWYLIDMQAQAEHYYRTGCIYFIYMCDQYILTYYYKGDANWQELIPALNDGWVRRTYDWWGHYIYHSVDGQYNILGNETFQLFIILKNR